MACCLCNSRRSCQGRQAWLRAGRDQDSAPVPDSLLGIRAVCPCATPPNTAKLHSCPVRPHCLSRTLPNQVCSVTKQSHSQSQGGGEQLPSHYFIRGPSSVSPLSNSPLTQEISQPGSRSKCPFSSMEILILHLKALSAKHVAPHQSSLPALRRSRSFPTGRAKH